MNNADSVAEDMDLVKSHTMRKDKGTVDAPRNVQNWKK